MIRKVKVTCDNRLNLFFDIPYNDSDHSLNGDSIHLFSE